MIEARKSKFTSKKYAPLYQHILKRQRLQIKLVLPIATAFCVSSFFAILFNPVFFIDQSWNIVLVLIEVVFVTLILAESMNNFSKRVKLVEESRK